MRILRLLTSGFVVPRPCVAVGLGLTKSLTRLIRLGLAQKQARSTVEIHVPHVVFVQLRHPRTR